MIIAIPTDDGKTVSEHFGRARQMIIAELRSGERVARKVVDNPHSSGSSDQSGHGKLLKMLTGSNVRMVVCADMGHKMEKNLTDLDVTITWCDAGSSIDSVLNPLQEQAK